MTDEIKMCRKFVHIADVCGMPRTVDRGWTPLIPQPCCKTCVRFAKYPHHEGGCCSEVLKAISIPIDDESDFKFPLAVIDVSEDFFCKYYEAKKQDVK